MSLRVGDPADLVYTLEEPAHGRVETRILMFAMSHLSQGNVEGPYVSTTREGVETLWCGLHLRLRQWRGSLGAT